MRRKFKSALVFDRLRGACMSYEIDIRDVANDNDNNFYIGSNLKYTYNRAIIFSLLFEIVTWGVSNLL